VQADWVESAAGHAFRTIQAGSPAARIVVIGLIWPNDQPPPPAVAMNEAVRREAQSVGVPFVDALSNYRLGPQLIGADKIHPTDEGHRVLATWIEESLLEILDPHHHCSHLRVAYLPQVIHRHSGLPMAWLGGRPRRRPNVTTSLT
jgi:hypothetical protein